MLRIAGLVWALLVAGAVVARAQRTIRELEVAMFCTGARTIKALQKTQLHTR